MCDMHMCLGVAHMQCGFCNMHADICVGCTLHYFRTSFPPGAGCNKHWLHPKNLSILHSTLLPLSPRWKELGHELGFLESELTPIEDHRGLDTPDQQLQQLLRQWLAWAPPKHPLPFSEEILTALIQIGETDLASQLEHVIFGSEGNDDDLPCDKESDNFRVPGCLGVRDWGKGSEGLHLLPSHLPALFSHLEGLSPKWRDMGIKLGFPVEEIKKIERENGLFEVRGKMVHEEICAVCM